MTRESVQSILCELEPLELQPSGSALYCCELGSQDAAARARAGGQGGELSCEASAAKPHAGRRPRLAAAPAGSDGRPCLLSGKRGQRQRVAAAGPVSCAASAASARG